MFLQKRRAFFIFLGIGIAIAIVIIQSKPTPQHQTHTIPSKTVRTIEAKLMPVKARALGYGTAHPTTILNANAELAGKIIFIHPELKQGATLKANTDVLKIDPTTFELDLAQSQADLAINQINLIELNVEVDNTKASLNIALRALAIGEKELKRNETLVKQKQISQSTADNEAQNVLKLRQDVQNLKSQLAIIPSRQSVIEAQIQRAQAQVKIQQENLAKTIITLPFEARIGVVAVEKDQFVATGAQLFEASNMDRVEIDTQLALVHARPLVLGLKNHAADGIKPMSQDLIKTLNLEVEVRLVGLSEAKWKGTAVRLGETLDDITRTLTITVAVENTYQKAILGVRPPLLKGMFTEVEFQAPAQIRMAIPRHAIHQGKVYLVSKTNTLHIQSVVVAFNQGELSIIQSGLKSGDQLVLDDLIPAIEGMTLKPQADKHWQTKISELANGIGSFK